MMAIVGKVAWNPYYNVPLDTGINWFFLNNYFFFFPVFRKDIRSCCNTVSVEVKQVWKDKNLVIASEFNFRDMTLYTFRIKNVYVVDASCQKRQLSSTIISCRHVAYKFLKKM